MICPATPIGSRKARLMALSGTAGPRRESSWRALRNTRNRLRHRRVELGLDDRLAAVPRLELGQLVGAVADDLRQLEEHASAVLRGYVLPRSFVERRARCFGGPVHVGRAGVRHSRDDLGGGGIDDVDRLVCLRRDELAVDVELVCFHAPLRTNSNYSQ
jgi:hypothetical protein